MGRIRYRNKIGNGLKFPSSPTQFLRGDNLGSLYTSAVELSYEYMFLTTNATRTQVLMRASFANWASKLINNGFIEIVIFSGNSVAIVYSFPVKIEPNRIYHVLFVNNGLNLTNSVRGYLNGVEYPLNVLTISSTFPFSSISDSRNGVTFGQFAPNGSPQNPSTYAPDLYFEGTVYRTALYNRIITSSEAMELAHSKTPAEIAPSNLLHYCDYNQVRGVGFEDRTVVDLSGNNLPLYASGFGSTLSYGGGAWVDELRNIAI